MQYLWILVWLMLGTAFAQSVAPPKPAPQHKPAVVDDDDDDDDAGANAAAPVSKLPPRTAVITIKGVCDRKVVKPAAGAKAGEATVKTQCDTVVSRKDFEELADALQPGMAAAKRQQLGDAYSKFLVMAHEASKRGLDKGTHFQELMEFSRVQILTQELDRYLQNEAAKISDADVSDFYAKSPALFERASMQRIFVPHSRRTPPAGDAAGVSTNDAMKLEADSLRARAAAGEDFEPLQKEAFAAAGLKGTSSTSMSAVGRSNLPAAHAAVFALKPGEISEVIGDSTGFYVYKMGSKQTLPLEQVKDEVAETLRARRMTELTRSAQGSATIELNEAYFAPADAARETTSKVSKNVGEAGGPLPAKGR